MLHRLPRPARPTTAAAARAADAKALYAVGFVNLKSQMPIRRLTIHNTRLTRGSDVLTIYMHALGAFEQ